MAFNYKQYETAKELEVALKNHLFASVAYVEASGETTVTFGSLATTGGGGTIVIRDQRGAVDEGWKDIVARQQAVYTTGVAKIILESTGTPSGGITAGTKATGTISLLNVVAGKAVTIAGVTFTEGVEFTIGADDNATAASLRTAIVNAFAGILTAAIANSANPGVDPAIITLSAASVGTWANAIALVSNDASMVVSGALMAGGLNAATGGTGTYCAASNIVILFNECARRGLRVELYYTTAGTAPTLANLGAATFMGGFDPNVFWGLSGRV